MTTSVWQALKEPPAPTGPPVLLFQPRALARYGTAVAVSGVVLAAAWYVVAGKPTYNSQVPMLDLAVLALIAAQAGGIALLLSGRRAVGLRRVALLGQVADEEIAYQPRPTVVADAGVRAPAALVGAAGLRRYHRDDCSMAVGKDWPAASQRQHELEGRSACGVCRP